MPESKKNAPSLLLSQFLAKELPAVPLVWHELDTLDLRGLLLEAEAGARPLGPESVAAVMQRPPFWSILWPSGEAVCRLLRCFPHLVQGRRVLDFGAGSGLVACSAAKFGALESSALDQDSVSRLAIEVNARANQASVRILDRWQPQDHDLTFFADVFYDEEHLGLLDELAAHTGEYLIADTRLKALNRPDWTYLGAIEGLAVPDLDPHREFGEVRFWFRGERGKIWESAFASWFLRLVADTGEQC